MKYYMAPLEGITGYIYRNAYSTYFKKFDKYLTPFQAPHGEKERLTHRERNDVAPEHNEELWFYMGTLFDGWDETYAKQIRKCNRLSDYEQIVKQIFISHFLENLL